tara:strand:+ start:80 stop:829 length:750 start_codon:yes stop_codon:yes gene_type:complete
MFYRILIILFFLFSCSPNTLEVNNINNKVHHIYSNIGFALIYNDDLKKQKIINKSMNDRSFLIFQKNLKKNKTVKVTNLINNKSVIAIVGSNSKYPSFYNSVITKRIAEEIKLNTNEPYVKIQEINNENTFIAKKSKMFEEEKKVANTAPVTEIKIKSLRLSQPSTKVEEINLPFNYIIKLVDFYYKDSAESLINRLKDEIFIKNVKIKKISDTKYRVYLGPYADIIALKKAFDDILKLDFENIEVIKL